MHLIILHLLLITIINVNSASFEIKNFKHLDNQHGRPINSSFFDDEKVYKGNSVKENSFPFIIGLFLKESVDGQFCGGSLLTSKHILTAAHCVPGMKTSGNIAIAGLQTITNKNEAGRQKILFNKASVKSHPNYDKKSLNNDIAIITLDQDFKLSNAVKTICIGVSKQKATVAGWGIANCDEKSSNVLLQATGNVMANKDCTKELRENIGSGKLCMKFNKQASDRGDSGGPLFDSNNSQFQQVGLVSYGPMDNNECPITSLPDVYTRVNQYKSFIEGIVGKNVFC